MKKLIIDRKKWRRGFKNETRLLNENGMCCLGFDALNEGFTESDIRNLHYPSALHKKIKGITILEYVWKDTEIAQKLAYVRENNKTIC